MNNQQNCSGDCTSLANVDTVLRTRSVDTLRGIYFKELDK